MKALASYIREELEDKKDEKSPVEGISLKRLLPENILKDHDNLPKAFQKWFDNNCELEILDRMSLIEYAPVMFDINTQDIGQWVSQNLDKLVGKPEEEKKAEKSKPAPKKDTEEGEAKEPAPKPANESKEDEPEQTKEAILDGTPPKSAIFCRSTEDSKNYSFIWTRLDDQDENWQMLKTKYKKLKEKGLLDILTFSPYEEITD